MNKLKETEKQILDKLVRKSTIDHINFEIEYNNDIILIHSIKCYTDIYDEKKDNMIMIHGICGNTVSFAHIIDHLTDQFNLYIIDLPGFGQSYVQKKTLINLSNLEILDFYADVIKRYIDTTIKSENNLICLGSSFGGLIATEFAHRYPKYFETLLLMSPAGIFPFTSRYTYYIGTLFKYSFPQCIIRLFGKYFIHLLACLFGIFSKHVYYDLILLAEKHTFGDLLVAKFISIDGLTVYHNYPVLFKLLSLKCKVGLIYTEKDYIMPAEHGIKIHKMSKGNIPLHIINNAGHAISCIDGKIIKKSIIKVLTQSKNYTSNQKYEDKQMNILFDYNCNFNIFKSKNIISDFYNNFE